MLVLMDAFQPEGVTKLAQDSVFMMPHLGVLSTVHPEAAMEIFEKDCLVRLGTCIAPVGLAEEGQGVVTVKLRKPDGSEVEERLTFGQVKRIPLPEEETVKAEIKPSRRFDVGAGKGRSLECGVEGGVAGIVIDARGRPFILPEKESERKQKLIEWFADLDLYPEPILERCRKELD